MILAETCPIPPPVDDNIAVATFAIILFATFPKTSFAIVPPPKPDKPPINPDTNPLTLQAKSLCVVTFPSNKIAAPILNPDPINPPINPYATVFQ